MLSVLIYVTLMFMVAHNDNTKGVTTLSACNAYPNYSEHYAAKVVREFARCSKVHFSVFCVWYTTVPQTVRKTRIARKKKRSERSAVAEFVISKMLR